MINIRTTLICFFSVLYSFSAYSEEEPSKSSVLDYIGGTVDVRTMHLWRGIEVSDEVNVATDVHFKTKDNSFKIGLWGGAGVNGNFKEFDYYASYTIKGLTLAVWDVYNFSPGATYNNRQAFNYKASETGHYIDAMLTYRFSQKFPLKVFYSTIVFGRDRGPKNDSNKYSTYVELEYPVIAEKGLRLDAAIGGAFSYKTKANFYGNTAGVVDIHLRLVKDVYISGYKVPIYVMPMWNPQGDNVNMQFGVTLFSL